MRARGEVRGSEAKITGRVILPPEERELAPVITVTLTSSREGHFKSTMGREDGSWW